MGHILHMSYMTGDIFGITAALALDPSLKIVFAYDKKDAYYTQNEKFYQACHVWESRVVVFNVCENNPKATAKGVYSAFKALYGGHGSVNSRDQASVPVAKNIKEQYSDIEEVHAVTSRVAAAYKADFKGSAKKVLDMWQPGQAPPESLKKLQDYTDKFVSKDDSQCVVLWSRESGKRGGAHVELDSGYQGIRQLVDKLSTGKRKILLAGDDRMIHSTQGAGAGREQSKLRQIAEGRPGVKAMSNFWTTDDYKDIWNGDEAMQRVGQMLLWKNLEEAKGGRLVHVGMRSGNLETFAMLGMKVVYLEVKGSPSGERMEQFAAAGIPYDRFSIERAPTKTGQIADLMSKEDGAGGITGKKITEELGLQRVRTANDRLAPLQAIVAKKRQAWRETGQPMKDFKPPIAYPNKKELSDIIRGRDLKNIPPEKIPPPHLIVGLRSAGEHEFKSGYTRKGETERISTQPKGFSEQDLTSISSMVVQRLKADEHG